MNPTLSVMALALHKQLYARRLSPLPLADCEAIMAAVLDETAKVAGEVVERKQRREVEGV